MKILQVAGQVVVQMRVPEISLGTGYRPKINTIFAVILNISGSNNKFNTQ